MLKLNVKHPPLQGKSQRQECPKILGAPSLTLASK